MKYRLGLDVGTNSLGWSVLELDAEGHEVRKIVAAGSRIFSDGRDSKTSKTLASKRREKRSARRRHDRYKQRREYLLIELTNVGLFPKDETTRKALQNFNPLELRARLLTESPADILANIQQRTHQSKDEAIDGKSTKDALAALRPDMRPEYLIGRALFHLNQRRGFKSNRKDKGKESGKNGVVAQSERSLLEDMGLIGPKEEITKNPEEKKKDYQKRKKEVNEKEYKNRKKAYEKELAEKKDFSYGVFLWKRQSKDRPEVTRIRRLGKNAKDLYNFYPSRQMYQDEFNKIWEAQAHHLEKLSKGKKHFYKIIFTQRPLKPQKRGKCTYMPDYERTFRAMPTFQRYRMYQDVNNLKWNDGNGFTNSSGPQSKEAHRQIIDQLEKPKAKEGHRSWKEIGKIIENANGLEGEDIRFNFMRDSKRAKGLIGNLTSNIMQGEDYVGSKYHDWSLDEQDEFIDIIINGTPKQQERNNRYKEGGQANQNNKSIIDGAKDEEEIIEYLKEKFDLSEQSAENCLNADLDEGTASVSKEAARRMLEKMQSEIIDPETGEIYEIPTQIVAARTCAKEDPENFKNPFRSKGDDGKHKIQPKLPYYGEFFNERHIIPGSGEERDKGNDLKYYGGVTNPTVHIALNQIRQVVNELIDKYNHPYSISVELGRDLPKGDKGRREIESEQKANQDKNDHYNKKLEELNQPRTSENRLRIELWEKQDKICPYTLDGIELSELFTNAIEVDHILPFSRSQDDSRSNKVVCKIQANRDKSGRTPWEAFHAHPDYNWNDIAKNAILRYWNKKDKQWVGTKNPEVPLWRFQENAFKIWEGESEEIEKAAGKMKKHPNGAVQSIGKQILEKGVGSLSEKQKKIAEEHGVPHPEFSPRHLNDTRYIGKLTREYLEAICHIDKIDVVTGRHTALLRHYWGLNGILKNLSNSSLFSKDSKKLEKKSEQKQEGKYRGDHRHHAIDAIVIGMTNKSLLKKIATESKKSEKVLLSGSLFSKKEGQNSIEPWEGFQKAVETCVKNIIVSHKTKRKKLGSDTTDGQLHNETALGLRKVIDRGKNEWETVIRRPIDYFKEAKHIEAICDESWREKFLKAFEKEKTQGVANLAKKNNIRSLRCKGPKQAIPICDKDGKPYKGYQGDSNWGVEIYTFPEGHIKAQKWEGVVISRYDANQPGFQPGNTYRPQGGQFVMRLQINDCIELDDEDKKSERNLVRIHKMSQNGQIFFVPLEATDESESKSKSANRLRLDNPCKVHISPAGRKNYEIRRPTNCQKANREG